MPADLYLSGKSASGPTQILRISNRNVEQAAELGRLLGFDPETIIVCLWTRVMDFDYVEITPSVRLVVWPGRN